MQIGRSLLFTPLLLIMATSTAWCAGEATPMRVDEDHVRTWNRFADALFALHEKRIAGRAIKTVERIGGYAGMPEFYKEVEYIDAASGQLLSRIQWERQEPDTVHVIEVFFYDDQGRVTRDFTAAFLPRGRNAPSQTLIALHNYSGELHAFRTFDASGNRIYEQCEGTLSGKQVWLTLEEQEIMDAQRDARGIMTTPAYKTCFGALQQTAGAYLTPR